MRAEIQAPLRKIKRLSLVLRAGCTVLLGIVLVILLAATIAVISGRATTFSSNGHSFPIGPLEPRSRLILIATIAATAGVMFKSLFHLRRLMGNYSRGEVFTGDSSQQIRQLGISCILWGGIKIVWAFVPYVLSSEPTHSFAVNLDCVFIGAVVIVISWFAEMAARLREENELTI